MFLSATNNVRMSPIPRPQFNHDVNRSQDSRFPIRRIPQTKKESPPMSRQGNKNTPDTNTQSKKVINFAAITEDDIEDDREYFDLSTLQASNTQLHVRSSNFHLTYGKVPWSLRARKEVCQCFQ